MNSTKTFPKDIRKWREREKLTQAEAAVRFSTSQGRWSEWESGARPCKALMHAILKEIYGAVPNGGKAEGKV